MENYNEFEVNEQRFKVTYKYEKNLVWALTYVNGQEVKVYGSQGQKRTAALSLKMAEIEIVEKTIGEKPILLLDDVLSELDRNRQNYLLENIKGIQTIITCTGLEEFVTNGININQTFEIVNGKINDH